MPEVNLFIRIIVSISLDMAPKSKKPLTAAERKARQRAKLQQGDLSAVYKREEAARIKRYRKMIAVDPNKRKAYHERDRDRKRAVRNPMKSNDSDKSPNNGSPYRCRQSFEKALARARRNLPASPSNRKTVSAAVLHFKSNFLAVSKHKRQSDY